MQPSARLPAKRHRTSVEGVLAVAKPQKAAPAPLPTTLAPVATLPSNVQSVTVAPPRLASAPPCPPSPPWPSTPTAVLSAKRQRTQVTFSASIAPPSYATLRSKLQPVAAKPSPSSAPPLPWSASLSLNVQSTAVTV